MGGGEGVEVTTRSPDPATVRAMLREMASGVPSFSVEEMRRNPRTAHLLRGDKEMGPIKGALAKAMRAQLRIPCIAPVSPPCANPPIDSHSLQRRGALAELANATNHVTMFKGQVRFDAPPRARAELVGINDATTFPGFCNEHDTEVFAPIERGPLTSPSLQQMFLLSYRAVAREYYGKLHQLQLADTWVRIADEDAGAAPEVREVARINAEDIGLGARTLAKTKRLHDEAWRSGKYLSGIRYQCKRVGPQRFAVAGFFTPAYDFSGRPVPRSRIPEVQWPWLTLSVIPDSAGALVSMSWDPLHERALDGILGHVRGAGSPGAVAAAAWELAVRWSENIAIAPTAWAALSKDAQQALEEVFTATIHERRIAWPGVVLPLV